MKTLYLLRHAHSEQPASAGLDDHDRMLSARGVMEAENLGAFMKEQRLELDAVFCSTSARTKETLRIALRGLFGAAPVGITMRFDRTLYLAEPDLIRDEIESADDHFQSLMIVGHNPGLEDLAERLARHGGQEIGKFPPCTLAIFDVNIGDWRDFMPKKAKLKTLFMP